MSRTTQLRQLTRPIAASPAAAGFHPAAAALAVAAAFLAVPGRSSARATGAQVVQGQASVSQQGTTQVITTRNGAGTSQSVINWQSFNVPAGTVTRFNQPDAASTSINRVLGNDPSAIFGTLTSNGKLVLVNPSGITVGAGAVVDTAGFIAATLRMSDADALAGRLVFGGDGLAAGQLAVEGRVLARSGDVVLIASGIQLGADALVQASKGATLLAAGRKVAVTGRGLEGIQLELQAPQDRVLNLGTLQGDAVGIFAGAIRHSGLIQATAASSEGGRVVLKGQQEAGVDGRVLASRGEQGGEVHVTAASVVLKATATIDVSGPAGGGEALVGGARQPDGDGEQPEQDAGQHLRVRRHRIHVDRIGRRGNHHQRQLEQHGRTRAGACGKLCHHAPSRRRRRRFQCRQLRDRLS